MGKVNKRPQLLRYAAIDIGSNAVRLLLCNAIEEENGHTYFKKAELVRIPLRLGMDAFSTGRISQEKSAQFIKTMQAFKLLIDVFAPVAYRGCATASLREASNGQDLIRLVKRECKLDLEIISGKMEAELIYANHIEEELDHHQAYLYVDVGGGSTELTLFDRGRCLASRSFNVGTIRMLQGRVTPKAWDSMKEWTKKNTSGHAPLTAIGSGGNINKIMKLLNRDKEKSIEYSRIRKLYDELKSRTLEERMEIWSMNPDRADVIVPAARIFLGVMKVARISNILVPQIGLADGIVHRLHEEFKQKQVA